MASAAVSISFADEAKYRAWAKDPVQFAADAVKIETKVDVVQDDGRVKKVVRVEPFVMRDYQIDCIHRFEEHQIVAVLKARQIGLTTTACMMALWLLLFFPNRFILVLSKNDEDAKKFMRRIKNMYDRLPPWVKARSPQLVGKWGKHEGEFDNGSVIYSATSSSDHGRGDTPTDVFLDEVGKMRNQDDSWSALIPAVEAGGNLRMFGTAEGYRDWFHLKWLEWEVDSDTDTIFYGWDVVDGRDAAWAQKMRRRLGDALFKREYPLTADEAFVSSGSNVFAVEVLLEIEADPQRRCRIMRSPSGEMYLHDELTHDDEFGFFVYEPPMPGAKYLVIADPAEGLVDGDPSCIQVLRWGDGSVEQVAVYRARVEPEDCADQVHQIALFYNRASVAVERNNHGMTVLLKLRRLRTPNVIRGGAGKAGLWTSKESKATNIALTRKALADGHVVLRDQRTIDELLGFQEKKTDRGTVTYEGTEHDDHVDALCIGVGYAVTYAPYEQPADTPPAEEPPHPFSFDGLMAARRLTGTRIM